jgi:hypothetical protein
MFEESWAYEGFHSMNNIIHLLLHRFAPYCYLVVLAGRGA